MKILIGALRLRLGSRLASLITGVGAIALTGCLGAAGAIAQVLVPADSGPTTLTEQGIQFEGTTGGDYSLMRLAGRDRRRRLCLGYGDEKPDHILILTEEMDRLSLSVMSEGDTTLLVDGPRGIDCSDNDRRNSRDAAVKEGKWPAGTYRIWVGTFNRGDRLDYKLLVSESGGDR